MNDELVAFFQEQGCDDMPAYNEGDAMTFLRHRAMCRHCNGLSACQVRGMPVTFALSDNKTRASVAVGPCKLRQADNILRLTEKLFLEAAIPPSLQSCRLDNFITQGRGEKIRRAKEAAENAIELRCSLVLAGNVGTGKTHLAAAIAHAAIDRGEPALFISAIGYLQRLRATFEKKESGNYSQMVEHIKAVNCLVIDDLGAEKPSSWTIERLYDAINTRLERQVQTIITTNFTNTGDLIEHMKENPMGAERIASRLILWGWLVLEGEDYRAVIRKNKSSSQQEQTSP